eukprot:3600551-Alexandrium_andersonii.AAC.1
MCIRDSRNGPPPPRLLAEAEHATAPRSGSANATSMRTRTHKTQSTHTRTNRATGRRLASWPRPSARRRP